MTSSVDQLWDALRLVACTTKLKAHCVVILRREDVAAMKLLHEKETKADRSRLEDNPGGPVVPAVSRAEENPRV